MSYNQKRLERDLWIRTMLALHGGRMQVTDKELAETLQVNERQVKRIVRSWRDRGIVAQDLWKHKLDAGAWWNRRTLLLPENATSIFNPQE